MANEQYNIGPCLALLGDPTTASGMTYLGPTRGNVTIQPQIQIHTGMVDQSGMIPRADAIFNSGPQPVASVPLVDEAIEKLQLLLSGSSVQTSGSDKALLLGSGVKQIAVSDINTFCVIPMNEISDGVTAANGWWFPRAITTSFGNITFTLPSGNDLLSNQARTTTITSLYYETDQAGTTVPADARPGFRGDPSIAGLTGWQLPDLTTLV